MLTPSTRARAIDDLLELRLGIEIKPYRNAETIAQRIGQKSGAGGRADQREFGQVDLHRARRRPRADDEIELEVLHRRIEDLLDRRIEPVDFVDEEHVALFEIGEERREVAGLGDDRTRRGAEIHAELARDDLRQRSLAEPGRPDEQDMIECLVACARRLDEHREVFPRLLLADEFRKLLRAQRRFRGVFIAALGVTSLRPVVPFTPLRPACICSATAR